MKFLITVIRQNRCVRLLSNAEDEAVSAPDSARWWGDERIRFDCPLELGTFGRIDTVPKRGIHDDGDQNVWMVFSVRRDGFVELFETGKGSALSGQIRSVDDDVLRHNTVSQASRSACIYDRLVFTAVLWDFGGVILSSPFEAFNHYEARIGLPRDFIRTVNSTNPHSNAWALLERNELSPADFDHAFADDSKALGHLVRGSDVLALLSGEVRPRMVAALDAVRGAGYKTACLTNNVVGENMSGDSVVDQRTAAIASIMARFDAVVESSKVGVRKPEPRFYEIACELLDVGPEQCVFLDDLGINLKPAAAMGMTTIKVVDPDVALADLSRTLDLAL